MVVFLICTEEEMMARIERLFRLYRYQINAVTTELQAFQTEYMKGIHTIKQLVARKNELFLEALNDIDKAGFKYKRAPITHIMNCFDTTCVIQLGAYRPIKRTTKELVKEEIDNWPALIAVIDNRPDKQFLAIEMNPEAFQYTNTVADMLEANLDRFLRHYQLNVEIEPLFVEEEFWNIVRKGKVSYIRFYLDAPNLAELSRTLSDTLKTAIKRTNTDEALLQFRSSREEGLQVSKDDPDINGLAQYISGGGGNAAVKIKGITKVYKTKDETRTISIDETILVGNFDPRKIGQAIKAALDNVE